MQFYPQQQHRTPEIYGDYWFNSEPIPLNALRGYTVLIHFWDYTSLASLHMISYIKEWYKRYEDKGLYIIGVHSPAFSFGKDPVHVRKAIERLGIKYPVVMDNERMIWGAFGARVLPTQVLIDKHGYISVTQDGEGSYLNFEHSIQSQLSDSGYRADFPIVMEPLRDMDRPGAITYKATPEILGGYHGGRIGNIEGYVPESTGHFEDPGFYLEGRVYLAGDWLITRDHLQLNESDGGEGHLSLLYNAKEVCAVVSPEGEMQFQVFIKQNGKYLNAESKGEDILIDDDGRSYFLVNEARLYKIINNKEYNEYKLTLSTRSNGFALYSISFVSSLITGVISYN
ncbi:MAG: redoxin family protein [Bacteroidota bacterium]